MNLGELYGTIGMDVGPMEKGLAKAEGLLRSFGGKAGALAAVAGGAIGATIGAAVVTGMNMEPAKDKLAASLGLVGPEADRVGKLAGKVFADNWGESMEDAASRTGAVITSIKGMREASDDEILGMTAAVSAVADTFEIDAARIAQVTGQMLTTGLASSAQEGVDLLASALSRVPDAVREDVIDAADEYGPFFAQLGVSGETAMTMLVDASEKGMYGIDKTGDAIKEFTIRATDMSTATGDAYKALGMNQKEMTTELLAGGDRASAAFAKIVGGLQEIKDPAAQSQAALALFGTPLEDLSTGEIPGFIDQLANMDGGLGDVTGAAERMADTLRDNASANIESFMRKIQTGAVDYIGGQFLPALNDVTGALDESVGPAFQTAGDNLQGFGEWVQKNSGWLLPLGTALAVVTAGIYALSVAQGIAAAGGFLAWIGNITKATQIWQGAQALLNIVMAANPLALVVLGIAALVAAFIVAYNTSEDFRRIVNGALDWVQRQAKGVGEWFTRDFVGFFTRAGEWVGNQFDGIGEWFGRTADDLRAKGQRVGDFFMKDVPGFFGDASTAIGKAFGGVGDMVLNPLRDAVKWINNSFIGGINGMLGKLSITFRVPTIPGFSDGGYTGPGGKYVPAGVVHAGEIVWSQDDIRRWGGVETVESMRRSTPSSHANGGIVPNATQGFRGYHAPALAAMRMWAAASGQIWHMTGLGGARSREQQALLYQRYLNGGNLAAPPWGNGPHLMPAIAMDINPHPAGRARSLLRTFGLGLTVPGEPWHIQYLGGRNGAATGSGGGGFDFGLGGLIDGLLKGLNIGSPWGDVVSAFARKIPSAIIDAILGGYAGGTMGASPGLHPVGENGAELVLGPMLKAFNGGERVVPLDPSALGAGTRAEDLREALDGLHVDIDNGRLFFRREMASWSRTSETRTVAENGVTGA